MEFNKENLIGNATPRRLTRSMAMKDVQESAKKISDQEPASKTPRKAAGKTVTKTPSKSSSKAAPKTPSKTLTGKTPKKTPRKTEVKSPEKIGNKTPRRTLKKESGDEKNKKTPGPGDKARSTKKVKTETPRSLRATRSRSIVSELAVESGTRKNLFQENVPEEKPIKEIEATFRRSQEIIHSVNVAEISKEKESKEEETMEIDVIPSLQEKQEPQSLTNEVQEEQNSLISDDEDPPSLTPEKNKPAEEIEINQEVQEDHNSLISEDEDPPVTASGETPQIPEFLTSEDQTVCLPATEAEAAQKDSNNADSSVELTNPKDPSIITIADSPIVISDTPFEKQANHTLNETFSPEPKDIVFFKDHQKTVEEDEIIEETPARDVAQKPTLKGTPYIHPVLNSVMKNHFAPALASTALKSSILLENKFVSPLKSIRKRSFSTTDADCTKKFNRVKFHSPANMEITIDEIDDGMRPHHEEIRLERAAHVAAAKAKDKKVKKGRKRSMSNIETEPAKKRAMLNISAGGGKTPTKEGAAGHVPGKVPNFSAIHAASFSKMENLVDYKNRKEERAKNLLSNSLNLGMAEKKVIDAAPLVEKAATKSIPVASSSKTQELQLSVNDGGNESTNVGTLMRPVNVGMVTMRAKVEERKQKWRAMHKSSGRHDSERQQNASTTTTTKGRTVLKGVRTNRRFDLMMKFREKEN